MNKTDQKHILKVVHSSALGLFIRLGYVIRGILYGSVGLGALQLAMGLHVAVLDTQSTIEFVHSLQFGNELLGVMIVGLAGYVLWGIMRAFSDLIGHTQHLALYQRIGYLFSAFSYLLLLVFATLLIFNGSKPSTDAQLNRNVSTALSLPFGNMLVMIVGLSSIGAGFYQVIRAVRADKPIDFLSTQKHKVYSLPFMIFAKTGIAIRGLTFAIVGGYIVQAGWNLDPKKAHTLHKILTLLRDAGVASFLLPVVGVGFISFGIYSVLLSRWVDLPTESYDKEKTNTAG